MGKLKGFWVGALIAGASAAPAFAQQQATGPFGPGTTICGSDVAPPVSQPPAGSSAVVYLLGPCWEAQGNQTVIEPATYLYYIHLRPSSPTTGVWIPYNENAEKQILQDFHDLWGTGFLDNLWIESQDYRFANGVIGKVLTYHMEERQRVKIVDYTGSKQLELTKIDEKLKDANLTIRLDTFIDAGLVRKVAGVVRDMMK